MKNLQLWDGTPFPDLIRNLPEIDVPITGVRGWLLQGPAQQLAFFDIEKDAPLSPHSHGEQWGLAICGEMDRTIGGETRRVGPGDWYHIPAGVVHSAVFLTRFQVIDFFADSDRYSIKRD